MKKRILFVSFVILAGTVLAQDVNWQIAGKTLAATWGTGNQVFVALTPQTVASTYLTIPDFAGVVDEFTFKTKAQTLSNKTFVAPVLGAASASSLSLSANQLSIGGTVTLTESSATAILTIPVAVSRATGGEIVYTVEASDASNTQARSGRVQYAVANTSAGTEICNVFGVVTTQAAGGDTTNAANPTQVQDGSGVGAITSGTLTYAWSVDTTGTNQCVLKLNAVSSLTQTTLQAHYTVIQSGPGASTGGD